MAQQQASEPALVRTLRAAADRIVPADRWPSASGAGVVEHLSRPGPGGGAVGWARLAPGLAALDAEAGRRHGRAFAALDESQQDLLLGEVEAGRVAGGPVEAKDFFAALVRLVVEGYYADPSAEGPGRAWGMVGFDPGPRPAAPTEVEVEPARWALGAVDDRYDAVVVGAGAGGGVAAAVLAEAGLSVLIIERGEWLAYDGIGRDHRANHRLSLYGNNTGPGPHGSPRTFLEPGGTERVTAPHEADYHNNAMTVGGGTRVFGAQAWRFFPDDFLMATRYGVPPGSSLADWPIGYDDLAPFYERAEWEVGVAGGPVHAGAGPRRRGYPMPPHPPTTEARRLADAAAALGWDSAPVPLLINTVERHGRGACVRCGLCVGFACPADAKNGTHNTVLLRALATGRCHLVTDALAERVDTDAAGRVTGVAVVTAAGSGVFRRRIAAGHVVLAGGAIESARLLLNSRSAREPHGLGNGHDQVGRHLQGHVYAGAVGVFDEPVQDGLGPGPAIATCRFNHGNPGVVGGGMLANEFVKLPLIFWRQGLPPEAPRWGAAGKEAMRHGYTRTSHLVGPTQEIPVADNRVRLSPTVRDRFGVPVAMLSGAVHPETLRAADVLRQQAATWLAAAGAGRIWPSPPFTGLSGGQHQAGTLRMGTDPATSVTDPSGRVHGHANLWVADGSVHVTNGGLNPVLTIMALALRTAGHLTEV